MKMTLLFRGRTAAYTLFEIMLVLAIIAVLAGAAIFALKGNVDVAKIQRVDADFQALATQLKTYQMMNYNFPTTGQGLNALRERPTSDPKPRRWTQLLDREILDPWGKPYRYANPGKKSSEGFDLYSVGPDGQPDTADDIYYGS